MSSPSPPAPNPSQHQSLFQWVSSLHEVAKVLEYFTFLSGHSFFPAALLPYNLYNHRVHLLGVCSHQSISRVVLLWTECDLRMYSSPPKKYSSPLLLISISSHSTFLSRAPHSQPWQTLTYCLSQWICLLWVFLKKYLFIFWLCWVFIAARGLSLVAESRGCLLAVVRGLLPWWILLLRTVGSRAWGLQ